LYTLSLLTNIRALMTSPAVVWAALQSPLADSRNEAETKLFHFVVDAAQHKKLYSKSVTRKPSCR